jgi:phosphate starvation-inducible PhoH-like protein
MVVTGDITQLDLPKRASGLITVRQVLEGLDDIAFVNLTGKDVVRHSLVQRIVAAYDEADNQLMNERVNGHNITKGEHGNKH